MPVSLAFASEQFPPPGGRRPSAIVTTSSPVESLKSLHASPHGASIQEIKSLMEKELETTRSMESFGDWADEVLYGEDEAKAKAKIFADVAKEKSKARLRKVAKAVLAIAKTVPPPPVDQSDVPISARLIHIEKKVDLSHKIDKHSVVERVKRRVQELKNDDHKRWELEQKVAEYERQKQRALQYNRNYIAENRAPDQLAAHHARIAEKMRLHHERLGHALEVRREIEEQRLQKQLELQIHSAMAAPDPFGFLPTKSPRRQITEKTLGMSSDLPVAPCGRPRGNGSGRSIMWRRIDPGLPMAPNMCRPLAGSVESLSGTQKSNFAGTQQSFLNQNLTGTLSRSTSLLGSFALRQPGVS